MFKKTKYYPVNIDNKIIINTPYDTEREFLKAYEGKPQFIPKKGKQLNKYNCYKSFIIQESLKENL